MRRFNSEGSLLDLDFLPWKKAGQKDEGCESGLQSGLYTPRTEGPGDPEPGGAAGAPEHHKLQKEHSISLENLTEQEKRDRSLLRLWGFGESFRAYSDGQLAPDARGSTDSVGGDSSRARHPRRAKLSAAKLHLKSLFGQSPHSSHSNLATTDQRESVTDRRSRLHFMRQWSQVGHSKKKVRREELETWAKSLEDLLASQTGVAVFGAFLRSEFSEENLQFYQACEQYKHSSNNFSLQRRARDIGATYIRPGAAREVNLDSKTRDLTLQLLQAPSHSSLSHAQKRIYALLDTDCYPRFIQSSAYLSLLAEAD